MNNADRATLRSMCEIWQLTKTASHEQMNGQPWLFENAINPAGLEIRVSFPDGRRAHELPIWERSRRFIQARGLLKHEAEAARNLAMSYRDFKVGSAVLAFRSGYRHADAWRVFSGMNTKHAHNMRPVCSEPIAINAALAAGFHLIVGIVIVGLLREEDVGKLLTLHPCHDCRWFMSNHPLIDQHTLVHTTFPSREGWGSETWSAEHLLRYHRENSKDEFD